LYTPYINLVAIRGDSEYKSFIELLNAVETLGDRISLLKTLNKTLKIGAKR